MATRTRTILLGVLAIGAIGAAGWLATRPEIVPVDIAVLERGPIEVTVDGDGMTRVREVYEVSAPVSGRVLRSPVRVGDAVVEGETLVAQIEPGAPAFLDARARGQAEAAVRQAEAAVSLAQTQISVAQADLDDAERSLRRVRDLFQRGTSSAASLETAELAVAIARAQFESAQASHDMRLSELALARAALIDPSSAGPGTADETCCIRLTAPVTGEVLEVANDSARVVSVGTPLLSIGKTDGLEITVDLLSTDAVRLAPGAAAYVERWGGDEALMAEVRVIEPVAFTKTSALGIEEQRVTLHLDFVSPPEARAALGHGFRVYLRIVEWHGEDELRLPISALFRDGGDWAVFTVEDGAARLRPVTIGRRNTEVAQVLGGLDPGEAVITHPSDRISDGVLVTDRAALD